MSTLHLLNRRYTISRRTSRVLDSTTITAAAVAADRTPTEGYRAKVTITVPSGTVGSVTVNGTVGGTPAGEVLSFTNLGVAGGSVSRTTMRRWDPDTAVTVESSGFDTEPTGFVEGVKADGSDVKMLYTVITGWPGRIWHETQRAAIWNMLKGGVAQEERSVFFLHYSSAGIYTPRDGDEMVDSLDASRWRMEGTPVYDAAMSPHHYQVFARRQEQ